MNPVLLWTTAAVLGTAAAMVTGVLGLGATVIAVFLSVPLVLRADSLLAISGLLIGFGGLWLALLAWQTETGASLPDGGLWMVVGAAPLATGLLALLVR